MLNNTSTIIKYCKAELKLIYNSYRIDIMKKSINRYQLHTKFYTYDDDNKPCWACVHDDFDQRPPPGDGCPFYVGKLVHNFPYRVCTANLNPNVFCVWFQDIDSIDYNDWIYEK